MKKFFTVLSFVSFTAAFQAQQTVVLSENFSTFTAGGNTSNSGVGAPDVTDIYTTGASITPTANFPQGTKVYSAGGMAKLGTGSVIGSMTSKTLDLSSNGGNVTITFDVKGWSNAGTILVKVTGKADQTVSYSAVMAGMPETKTVTFTGGTAGSTVTFETPASSLRAFIDNIEIKTGNAVLAVNDAQKTKSIFVKNTLVKNGEILFGQTADKVKIFNMNGQIVKTFSVKENQNINVSDLPKGNYIVNATVNNTLVSQKIMKD
ncbi:hypothetical protein ASG01_13095 [Chryseobacterium sp. Leaf180]|uniref:T9SS type A sorting domain-containing protein n=1 Tax=Chryseobacterium sp. Leaf180 TaxID=1736289 RepID=UPI0006FD1FF2|nr:T9SS type A sorting domain-containing protein [Chryseobacterium sp. Leaf180]KQR91933.1 hypothetical protein ASG01_13095 [Chryseobacterium sp. Leaf180]